MLQPYKSFGMVCAKQQCTNHAKPSLCSGADLKVKLMLAGRADARAKLRIVKVLHSSVVLKVEFEDWCYGRYQRLH